MDSVRHPLQALLHFLVTDASVVAHLAHILDRLNPSCLGPSPYLQKWVSRVTSLMHSKDPAARWAAMCIAYKMSSLSKSLLVDNAQSWAGFVFPSLSKPEPVPVLKAAMRYLTLMLCAAGHNLEFQRQVAVPMVPKVSSALLTIAETHHHRDVKISSMRSLTQLVLLYPSLHKALSQRLFAFCHSIFSGSVHQTTDGLLDATANLYAVLHVIGGKVGGTNLWRNCLDEALHLSWSAWLTLRTTFPNSAQLSHKAMAYLRSPAGNPPNLVSHTEPMADNPLATVALNLDRLKCGVSAIRALLRVPVSRPVRVPIGHLSTFCWCLLTSTCDDQGQPHFDAHVRIAESTAVPQIWMQACYMLSFLTRTVRELLAPHASKMIMTISSQLENNLELSQRCSFLRCAHDLLYFCPVVGATFAVNRLMKAAIPLLSPLYLHQPRSTESSFGASGRSKASKKRRREYVADDVLSVTNTTVCETIDDCKMVIAALDVIQQCMLNVELAPSTRSIGSRVLLSILLSLPSIPPSSLSSDPSFYGRVIQKVRDVCVESILRSSHAMSKGTGLVLRSFSSENLATRDTLHSHVDLLLHPRRPPFVRTLPFIDLLSLSSSEESAEEMTIRQSLNLAFGNGEVHSVPFEPQARTEQAVQSGMTLDQHAPLHPPQEQVSVAFVKPHPQSTGDIDSNLQTKVTVPSITAGAPLLQAVTDLPAGPASSNFPQKEPAPTVYAVPMAVDESDHEEVPAIDLGSDSDV